MRQEQEKRQRLELCNHKPPQSAWGLQKVDRLERVLFERAWRESLTLSTGRWIPGLEALEP